MGNLGICKFCGEEYELSKRGKASDHCRKAECIKKAHHEAQKKYMEKKKKERQLAKIKEKTECKTKQENKVKPIYTIKDREMSQNEIGDISDILQIARELGSTRYSLIEFAKKSNEELSNCDKTDQKFLHTLEILKEEEILNMPLGRMQLLLLNEKENRDLRRNIKNKKYLIEALLDSILLKNPNAFIVQAVNSNEDVTRTIRRLKKDKTLYQVSEEDTLGNN